MNLTWPEFYLGIPWKVGGRNPDQGLDCWGLLRYVYKLQFGIELPEHAAPATSLAPSDHVTEDELNAHTWVELVSPAVGDVVALGKQQGFCHVGIYVETPAPSLLHSSFNCLSAIIPLKVLYRQGFHHVKYYRHVDRDPNQ